MSEQLRPIPGHPDYSASSDGRIWSSKGRGRWLKPATDKHGYRRVSLRRNGQTFSRTVHSLVAEAFLGSRPEGMDVCHNDSDPSNNSASNLRYDTRSENLLDKGRHGRLKTHCPQGHPYTRYASGPTCKTCALQRHFDTYQPKRPRGDALGRLLGLE